ncbi:MAG: F0F1 ATP synthase subunit B' [Kiloniellaceae bacterium]
MPQFDPTTFLPQLFWLAVTFAALFFVMRRYALPRLSDIMEARQERVTADLEKASTLKEEADKVLAEYEKVLAEARRQAAAAIKQAGDMMAAQAAKRHEAFGRELAEKTGEAENRIAAAKEEALAHLTAVASEAAAAATAKLIGADVGPDQVHKAVEEAMRSRG